MFSADDGRRHSAFLLRCEAEEAAAVEDRKDLLAYARRHGLQVRWEPSGFPGSELIPRLYKPGMAQPEVWPPEHRR